MDPSPDFLLLAATLLDAPLGDDTALLHLHALFGPMLLSALQLVDRREVLRIDLGGRTMFQVMGGQTYSLYLDLPEPAPEPLTPPKAPEAPEAQTDTDAAPPPTEDPNPEDAGGTEAPSREYEAKPADDRIRRNARRLRHMYCPCAGWAFNALDGRQVLCKHVLAVLLAHRMGRVVETRVGVHAAAGLVGAG